MLTNKDKITLAYIFIYMKYNNKPHLNEFAFQTFVNMLTETMFPKTSEEEIKEFFKNDLTICEQRANTILTDFFERFADGQL